MTWGEFKAAVEAAGVKDDTEVWEVRITAPLDGFKVIVNKGQDGSVQILEDW